MKKLLTISVTSEGGRKMKAKGKGKMRTGTRKFRLALTSLALVGLMLALVIPFVLVTPVIAETGSANVAWGKIRVDYSWPNEVVMGEEFDVTVTVTNLKSYSFVLTYLALNSGPNAASCQGYPYYHELADGFTTTDPISATDDGTPGGQIIRDKLFLCSPDWSPFDDPNAHPVELAPNGDPGDSYTFTWHLTATQTGTYDWTDAGGSDRSMVFVETWNGMMTYGNSDFSETIITVTAPLPAEVWVDDNYCATCGNDGHTWGYDAFNTIQDGIDAVAVGGTVNVMEGTYNEQVVFDKPVTLISDTGDYRTTGTILTGSGHIFNLQNISNIAIQGFRFENVTDSPAIFGGHTNAGHNIVIQSNSFINNYCHAVDTHYYDHGSGWLITDNRIDHVTGPNCSGLWLLPLSDGEISNNEISNTSYAGMILDAFENMVISGNTISDTPRKGIQVAHSSNVTIRDNYVTNTNTLHYADEGAITIYPDVSNIRVEGNTLTGNYQGFTVRDKSGTVSDVYVNCNNIYGNNGFGVANFAHGGGTVDATNNWWGDSSGPYHPSLNSGGTGDEVSDNVDFDPWLIAPPVGVCPPLAMSEFQIDHAKMDFKKKPDDDKVRVKGTLALNPQGDNVAISDAVTVTVGPLSETITMEEKGKKDEKWEYKRPKDGEGNIKRMTINWKNGKLDIRMDKADLGEPINPVTISVQIGDDVGSESILMREKKHHWDYKYKAHHH